MPPHASSLSPRGAPALLAPARGEGRERASATGNDTSWYKKESRFHSQLKLHGACLALFLCNYGVNPPLTPTAVESRSADFSPPPLGTCKSAGSGMNSALQVSRNWLNST